MHWHRKKKQNRERGAIVVEATIALTTFIFMIFTILSVVDICYVQSKMAVALNSASKEMSQYAYLYYTLNLDEHMNGEGGQSSEKIMEPLSAVFSKISNGTSDFSTDISDLFSQASEVAGGDSLAEYGKDAVGMGLAKQLVKKNLVSYKGDTAENFLRRNHVVNGLDGLNFAYTSFLTDVDQSEVDIVVSYDVEVIKLLNIDFKYKFVQRARSEAWKKGESIKNPSSEVNTGSIWDANDFSRGKEIVKNEKKNYTYTSDKNGFHAFDPDQNKFIRIRSLDTNEESYSDPVEGQKKIKDALQSSLNSMKQGVENLGDPITVKNAQGENVTLDSPKDSRKYQIVLVVPDGADRAVLDAAVADFKRKNPGVEVEVRTGYGDPTPKTDTE